MEITPTIKSKVFSQYIPYFINTPSQFAIIDVIQKTLSLQPTNYRLMLKPITNITEVEAIEIARMLCGDDELSVPTIQQLNEQLGSYKNIAEPFYKKDFDVAENTVSPVAINNIYQYLISKGYDLPNFYLGDKTLHESGLATYEVN